jgi:hypothetical protein
LVNAQFVFGGSTRFDIGSQFIRKRWLGTAVS